MSNPDSSPKYNTNGQKSQNIQDSQQKIDYTAVYIAIPVGVVVLFAAYYVYNKFATPDN
jgi:hypothetical protein